MRHVILGSFLLVQLLLVLVLAGCGGAFDGQDLRTFNPQRGDFTSALSREDQAFALFEAEEMADPGEAARFGDEAIQAACVEAVPPASDTALSPAGLTPAAFSPAGLTPAALDGDQLGNRFKVRGPRVSRAFTVFFEFDSAALTPESEQAMDAIAASAKAGGPLHVIVDGHADRAGTAPYNVDLSRRRANAVTRGLGARGLSRQRLAVHAFGETRPRVLTPDGLREPRNRRVEVVIGPGPAL